MINDAEMTVEETGDDWPKAQDYYIEAGHDADALFDEAESDDDTGFLYVETTSSSSITEGTNSLGMNGAQNVDYGKSYLFAVDGDAATEASMLQGTISFYVPTAKGTILHIMNDGCKNCKRHCVIMERCVSCEFVQYCGIQCMLQDRHHNKFCPVFNAARQSQGLQQRLYQRTPHLDITVIRNCLVQGIV